ncbi:Z1 domain-containing protein [Bacillus sp. NP157]|nr:Z1 domain-containing protein [Bacillus sp. NP157]
MFDAFVMAVGAINGRPLTDELLHEVMQFLKSIPALGEADLPSVQRRLEATIGVNMMVGDGVTDGAVAPWVEDRKASTDWIYWDSYSKQLRASGLPSSVVRTLDEDTDNILTQCGNPASNSAWRIQGLVMGDVQSGKTASYSGLVAKAADSGYKVIVLLTGTIEDLRSQTQERLDEGFVGRDSRQLLRGEVSGAKIGAGRFRSQTPNVLTSIDSDFLTSNMAALRGIPLKNINEPVLLVMKKNSTALRNLCTFLDGQAGAAGDKLAIPLLVIDDEADNASVNGKKDEDSPSTINSLIRAVLGRFHQATYVAYTATPFANVFINPDPDGTDLFPKNFIYSLSAPTSYIGASAIFGEDGDWTDQVVDIDDADSVFPAKHKKTLEVSELPPSLLDAANAFFLSCAIRDLRNEPLKHRSMLVNVTTFTDVQIQVSELLNAYRYSMIEMVKQYLADDDLWHGHDLLRSLHDTFVSRYSSVQVEWNEVRAKLYDSIASVKVVTVNQRTERAERLNYGMYEASEKGRRVIAVGGMTLSRGLTLQGLCVSYFFRSSKAYDTLLQMGRWFGYRPGYDDLCRIWMTDEVQRWFRHIAEVVAELRSDIRRMHANNQPPSQFGIRVRSHPDTLLVTAAYKMRNSEEVDVDLSFSGKLVSTPVLPRAVDVNKRNVEATARFIASLGSSATDGSRYIWSGVRAEDVATYLQSIVISPLNSSFIADAKTGESPLIDFIRSSGIDDLARWDVCLPQGEGAVASTIAIKSVDGAAASPRRRQRQFEGSPSRVTSYLKVNKQRVGEPSDERVGLTRDEVERAENSWRELNPGSAAKTVPGHAYSNHRTRPLLTIHVIEPKDSQASEEKRRTLPTSSIEPKTLIAISLSFPVFDGDVSTSVPYRLNKVYLREIGLIEEDNDGDD